MTNCLFAVDKLNQAINRNEIDFFSLGGTTTRLDNNLIWSSRISYTEARFFTSHYIGFYSSVQSSIKRRMV